ncbi:PIR Superfamily Protein [Plasmodium ovale wallikeri]|uniref:PIR Superfamily Protein n=1 Tax=Plasmodium ovale wallikeri TaxID=864142 RepID=A0A1A9AQX5_PLAOA|nr:PIR Superfamily Protein [Plasmodium ovale wallikeri]SBT59557.1 PIR Superfamily Protein [Plasmodium ovale wallikeri]
MSDTPVDSALSELLDVIWDKSPLYVFYESLNALYQKNSTFSCDPRELKISNGNAHICNIWGNVKNILNRWDSEYGNYRGLSSNKKCDYLNYWLYDKLNVIDDFTDVFSFYNAWQHYVSSNSEIKEKCYAKFYNGFTKEKFKKKKKLYDFLEYYNSIKDKILKGTAKNKKGYCDYIENIFQLYKEILYNNIAHVYSEDINNFQKIFMLNNRELSFVSRECPGRCLHLVFNQNNRNLCPRELEELKSLKTKEKTCEIRNNVAIVKAGDNPDYDDILNDSPAYKIYKKLNEENKYCGYNGYCIKINAHENSYPGISKLCTDIVENLVKLPEIEDAGDRNQRCLYYMYWIYDKINNMPISKSKNIGDYPVVHELFDVVNKVNHILEKNKQCYFDYNLESTIQGLSEMKYLHDYFNIYDHVKDKLSSLSDKKKSCEYITHINTIYEKYIVSCCHCYGSNDIICHEDCPNYFKCDEEKNPFKLYSDLNCVSILNKNIKKIDKPVTVDNYVKWLTKISHENPELLKPRNTHNSNTSKSMHNNSTYDPFYAAMIISFSFLGILFTFFLFYKFTPIESYIHRKGLSKKYIKHDFQDVYELEKDTKIQRKNTRNKRLQIKYHST